MLLAQSSFFRDGGKLVAVNPTRRELATRRELVTVAKGLVCECQVVSRRAKGLVFVIGSG